MIYVVFAILLFLCVMTEMFGEELGLYIGLGASGLFVIAWILLTNKVKTAMDARRDKCPKCEKANAMITEDKKEIRRDDISIKVENQIKDKEGNVTGTIEQYIPGKRIYYKTKRICKFCNYSYEYEYYLDEKSI